MTFDNPAYRMQRIVCPALAWAASLGGAGRVPAAMLGVNLAGVGAIAALASLLRAAAGVSRRAAAACCGRGSSSR